MAQRSYKRVLDYSRENSSTVREAASACSYFRQGDSDRHFRRLPASSQVHGRCTCRREEAGQERDSLGRCFRPLWLVCQAGGLGGIMDLVTLAKLIVFSLPSAETTEGV